MGSKGNQQRKPGLMVTSPPSGRHQNERALGLVKDWVTESHHVAVCIPAPTRLFLRTMRG